MNNFLNINNTEKGNFFRFYFRIERIINYCFKCRSNNVWCFADTGELHIRLLKKYYKITILITVFIEIYDGNFRRLAENTFE